MFADFQESKEPPRTPAAGGAGKKYEVGEESSPAAGGKDGDAERRAMQARIAELEKAVREKDAAAAAAARKKNAPSSLCVLL